MGHLARTFSWTSWGHTGTRIPVSVCLPGFLDSKPKSKSLMDSWSSCPKEVMNMVQKVKKILPTSSYPIQIELIQVSLKSCCLAWSKAFGNGRRTKKGRGCIECMGGGEREERKWPQYEGTYTIDELCRTSTSKQELRVIRKARKKLDFVNITVSKLLSHKHGTWVWLWWYAAVIPGLGRKAKTGSSLGLTSQAA